MAQAQPRSQPAPAPAGRPPTAPPSHPLRLAVDLRSLVEPPAGIGVYTLALVRELARQGGFEIHGLAHAPLASTTDLEAAGVRIAIRRAPLGVLWQQLLLPGMARALGADVLWSPITTLPLRPGVPAVATIHDLTTLLFPETHRLKVRWSVAPFLRATVEGAHAVVVDSHATASDVGRLFPDAGPRLHVVYPGVDEAFAPATPAEIEATRRELGLPGGYILWSGTLEPRKNVPTLLAAWERMRRAHPATPPLVLVGGWGWRMGALRREIDRLGREEPRHFRVLGRLDRARQVRVMQAATVFAFPSLYEGFGFPPLEAMACGVPVVTSDVSSLPEVTGPAALRVAPRDPDALGEALRRLLAEDEEAARRRRALGIAQAARFRWADAARDLAGHLRAAAGAGVSGGARRMPR